MQETAVKPYKLNVTKFIDISIEANLNSIFSLMVRKLTKYWGKNDISSEEKSCKR
jgi:hypothetical protein